MLQIGKSDQGLSSGFLLISPSDLRPVDFTLRPGGKMETLQRCVSVCLSFFLSICILFPLLIVVLKFAFCPIAEPEVQLMAPSWRRCTSLPMKWTSSSTCQAEENRQPHLEFFLVRAPECHQRANFLASPEKMSR